MEDNLSQRINLGLDEPDSVVRIIELLDDARVAWSYLDGITSPSYEMQ